MSDSRPPSSPGSVPDKSELRREMKDRRGGIPDNLRADKSSAACDVALEILQQAFAPTTAAGKTVALYASVSTELDPTRLCEELLAAGVRVVFPRVRGEGLPLAFHQVARIGELIPGYAGILEPADYLPAVSLDSLDAVFVPGLAFDRRGNRLGWGQGHYDQTLKECPRALRIGLCFEEQITAIVPTTPADERMDWVASDATCYPGRRDRSPREPS